MAHLIETIAYAGETPWHGIGKRVHNDLTPAQMMVEAGLDWRVENVPLYCYFNGKKIKSKRSAIVRDRLVTNMDTGEQEKDYRILTEATGNWNPVQNSEAFDFFHDFVMKGDMEMHTAGSLSNGEIVWILAKTKESFTLHKKDRIENYLLFTNSFRFGTANDIRMTPTRVVCNNTITLALNAKSDTMMKINHRKPFNAEEVKATLGIAHMKMEKYKELADFLSKKRYQEDKLKEYFGHLFPATNEKKDESRAAKFIREVVLPTQPGHDIAEGTWWQAFNAVTFFTNHEAGNLQRTPRGVSTRLENLWYGKNREANVVALNKAVEYAQAA